MRVASALTLLACLGTAAAQPFLPGSVVACVYAEHLTRRRLPLSTCAAVKPVACADDRTPARYQIAAVLA